VISTNSPERRGGRRRAFDPEAALNAAMRLFWTHGYEATSLAMLRDAMGLTPPQIYNAFTDKETLFRRALDRYLHLEAGFAIEALSAPLSTLDAIRSLLAGAARAYAEPDKPGGCLFVTGALAASPQAQAAITDRLRRGQAEHDIPPCVDVNGLAKFITGTIHGMSIQARDGATTSELLSVADMAGEALAARLTSLALEHSHQSQPSRQA
jgi:AcrR family transcriptional regulator